MKLTCVIPAYNEERYLEDCLRSIEREAGTRLGKDIEVVVVNNGSNDRTRAIAASFPFVRIVDEPVRSLTRARSTGVNASSGELIANIDADTRVPHGWIETIFNEFEKQPELLALSGPFIYYDLSLPTRALVRCFYGISFLVYLTNRFVLRVGSMLQGGNFIVRRSALEKIGGFDLSIDFYGEDTDIAKRLTVYGPVKWTFKFPIYSSGRRIKAEGLVRAAWRYTLNYFSVMFFGRPFSREHTNIRSRI